MYGKRRGRKRSSSVRSGPRYSRQSVTKNSGKGYDQLTVYRDPFSTRTTNPKIPDGKTRLSTGIKLQAVKEIVNNGTGTMDFMIYGGIGNGIVAINTARPDNGLNTNQDLNVQPDGTPGDSTYSIYNPYKKHVAFYVDKASNPSTEDFPVDQSLVQGNDSQASYWRLVSQAVKLSLVNNSDENDGWFEAIRVHRAFDKDEWFISQSPEANGIAQPGDGNQVLVIPDLKDLTTKQLVENPTYCTGKLRDIHKYKFQLKAVSTDHDFIRLRRSYRIGGQIGNFRDTPKIQNNGIWPLDLGVTGTGYHPQTQFLNFMEHTVDQSFDMIYIRVHGRVNAVNDSQYTAQPTRLLAHTVSNQELIFDDDAIQARFHTETDQVPNIDYHKKITAERGSHKAAEPMDTTAPRYKRRKPGS